MKRGKTKFALFYVLLFLVLYLLAAAVMPHLSIKLPFLTFGKAQPVSVKPDIILLAIISMGLLRGRRTAAIIAVIMGFVCDVTIGVPYMLSPVVYLFCGYYANSLSRPFVSKKPMSMLLVSIPLLLIKALVTAFYLLATWTDISVMGLIFGAVLPEYLYHVFAAPIVFIIIRIIMAVFRIPVKESEK